MTGLLIVGAGGHGLVVADVARELGHWQVIAFLDDHYPAVPTDGLPGPVLGMTATLPRWLEEYADLTVAIGDSGCRLDLLGRAASLGYRLPVLVHPSAWVSASAILGEGTVVMAQAAVQAATTIGRGGIVNTGACVDHHCVLADGVHVAPNATLGGNVRVGVGTWIGLGASVREGVRIGDGVVVAAGAAVVTDVPDYARVMGVPARQRGARIGPDSGED